jgi:hypothetical protein
LKDPATLLTSLLAYTIFTIIRYFAIYMVPLEPPAGLVVLKDPFTNFIYGGYFVTKDLFFSGHVGTVFLVLLSARTKVQRRVLLVASMVLAFFLLLQHVHYPIDVLASPVFAVASFNLAKLLLGKTKVVTASSLPAGLPIRFGKA